MTGAGGSGAGGAAARLAGRGITLPAVAAPAGAYVPAVRTGNLVYTSGQVPLLADGTMHRTGLVGADVSAADATECARICALNALAAVDALVGLDAVVRVVKVLAFVASAAATVVLPVPPLPVTTCSRASGQDAVE